MKQQKSGLVVNDVRAIWLARIALVVLSIITTVYALLVVTESNLPTQLVWLLAITSVSLLTISLLFQYTAERSRLVVIIIAHIAYGITITATGTDTLLVPWTLLLFMSMLLYGTTGILVSALSFVIVAISGVLDRNSQFGEYTVIVFAVLAIGYMMHELLRQKDSDHQALIDSRQHENARKQQLQTLLNTINLAVLTVSNNGIIRTYNAAALDLLDTNSDLAGNSIDTIVRTVDSDSKHVSLIKYLKSVQRLTERDDLLLLTSDDEKQNLSISVSPIKSSYGKHVRSQGYIVIMRDITKSKTLEQERDEFISVVSHELRTPVAISEGSLSNIQFMLKKKLDPSVLSESVDQAHKQITYLASMINDLSTLSRAERGVGEEKDTIDVSAMVHDLYNRYETRAKLKNIALELDVSGNLGTVTTSRLYLEEILQNFIINSIKYTHEGSVTIAVKATESRVHFVVKDTGIGISKSDLRHVFKKFYRSEDYRTRESSGTGLGLYVVEKLAKKIGIEIEVTSRLNHGSSFSFYIDR